MSFYIDTSAFVKLFLAETESGAMRRWWRDHHGDVFSSDLLRTEVYRTSRRISAPAVAAARQFLEAIPLISLDALSCERAGFVDPRSLRSLDALHLTAARALGDDLRGLVTYDDRLIEAGAQHGIEIVQPS